MACSFSESSSLSDLSSCTEDFKHSVSSHVPSRRGPGKLMRSGRISKRARRQQQAAGGYFGRTHPLGQTSGSEDLYESSMESIESNNATTGLTLHPLSALNQQPGSSNGGHNKKLQKISSADSLMSMIKSLAANRLSTSTPSSPQLSENGDNISSGGFPTPLTTPDTPCASAKHIFSPRSKEQKKLVRKISSSDLAPGSLSSSPSMSPTRASSQIMVEVLDPLNPRKDSESGDKSTPNSVAPTITLEVPGFSYGKCLSPIKELPSPMPTPIPSPIPFQRTKNSQEELSTSSSSSSGKSSSHKKAAASLLSSRRSSFSKLCKKAANSASRRSSHSEMKSCSMSTSDEDMIPLQEIKIHVPMLNTKPQSNIPMITITEPNEMEDMEEELDEEDIEPIEVPDIAVSPPSPRPSRKEFHLSTDESLDEVPDIIPQVTITVVSPPQTPDMPVTDNSKIHKYKPPPINIPNSNFRHFDPEIQPVNEENATNVPKDAMSKPDPSTTSSTRMSIELGERRSKAPNADQDHTATVKVSADGITYNLIFFTPGQHKT